MFAYFQVQVVHTYLGTYLATTASTSHPATASPRHCAMTSPTPPLQRTSRVILLQHNTKPHSFRSSRSFSFNPALAWIILLYYLLIERGCCGCGCAPAPIVFLLLLKWNPLFHHAWLTIGEFQNLPNLWLRFILSGPTRKPARAIISQSVMSSHRPGVFSTGPSRNGLLHVRWLSSA